MLRQYQRFLQKQSLVVALTPISTNQNKKSHVSLATSLNIVEIYKAISGYPLVYRVTLATLLLLQKNDS